MRIGRDDVDRGTKILEVVVDVGSVFHLRRAVERERRRHEHQNRPATQQVLLRYLDELASLNAWTLKGWTAVLINDMKASSLPA
jgi:hypothetical protein